MRYSSIVAAVVTILLTFPQEVVPAKRPEANSKPEDDFKATEDSGTASHVLCNVTGPCVPCSTAEKEEDWSVCKATGYRQPITCLLRSDWIRDQDQDQDQQQEQQATEEQQATSLVKAMPLRKSSRKSRGSRKLFEAEEGAVEDSAKLAALIPGETRLSALLKLPGAWRRHLSYEAANPPTVKSERRFDTFQSCSLESAKGSNESISVLVFEGVMALLLAGAIPVVVMRRKLSFVRKN